MESSFCGNWEVAVDDRHRPRNVFVGSFVSSVTSLEIIPSVQEIICKFQKCQIWVT